MESAIFAAGCFWGVQAWFDQIKGVKSTQVGYIGGHINNPTYEKVCSHTTGHAEAVLIEFDPKVVSYKQLLVEFFKLHDPTRLNGQGADVGDNYRSAIFYTNNEQKFIAQEQIKQLEITKKYDKPIVTELTKASKFWQAEEYHQKYFEKTGKGICIN